MKFIFADSLDYIDPNYDFLNDTSSSSRKPYWDDLFPHEFMDVAPYDGILVSRALVGDHLYSGKYTESQAMRFRREGARMFLRYLEKDYPGSFVFGDCGAFQYHKLEKPPYSSEDMVDFYSDAGFTHGCSVDHIIFDFDPQYDAGKEVPVENKRRREITLSNAESFLQASRQIRNFQPIGVVQAWSPASMADAARQLVGMGYDYIALGGLVPLNTKSIHMIMQSIAAKLRPNIKIHILGFAKANHLEEFQKYGISSFDTTSPLLKAFKDARHNYWSQNGCSINYYMAIKIPQVHDNTVLKNKIKSGRLRQEETTVLESQALKSTRAFGRGEADIDEALTAIHNYSRIVLSDSKADDETNARYLNNLMEGYRRTLTDRPWQHCNCRVCREAGIEVVIFRSSNRNKRRGIHNLGVFYDYVNNFRQGYSE